jgi:hypothetical protein
MDTTHATLIRQNEIIIDLLARQAIGVRRIYQIVVRGKRDPDAYVRSYNSLDGTLSVTDAAKIATVSQPTMTAVLQGWEAEGIVYNAGTAHKPAYKSLVRIPEGGPRAEEDD